MLWNTIWMEQKVWNPKNQLTPQVLFCADEKPAWGSVCVRSVVHSQFQVPREMFSEMFQFWSECFFQKNRIWTPGQVSASSFSSSFGSCTWYSTQTSSAYSSSSSSSGLRACTHFWGTGSVWFQVKLTMRSDFSSNIHQQCPGNFYKVLVDQDRDQFLRTCLSSTGLVVAISIIK